MTETTWQLVAGDLFRRDLYDHMRKQFESDLFNRRLFDPWFESINERYRVRNMIWNQIQDEL